jgi:DNA modification methylase
MFMYKKINKHKEDDMRIEKISTKIINPTPDNARLDLKPGDLAYDQLENSLKEDGYVVPMVWNERTGNLVGGNQRFKILRDMGKKEVEVSVVNLTPEKEKQLSIRLNAISGDWDMEKLKLAVHEIEELPDFDIKALGFDDVELSKILDYGLEDELLEEEAINDIDYSKEPVTNPGDLIVLDKHRILCGDSHNEEDVKKLMNGANAQLLVSDPPYNCNYTNDRPDKNKGKCSKWRGLANDNLDQAQYVEWLRQVFSNVIARMDSKSPYYIWQGYKQLGITENILMNLGCELSTIIVWKKPNPALSFADYNLQCEFCLYGFKSGEGKHPWYGATNESTLWEVKRDVAKELIHPTQKALGLILRSIKNSSRRGDIIVDPFLGSGSVAISSILSGRKCYGIEIDPWYVDAAIRRMLRTIPVEKVDNKIIDKYKEGRDESPRG